MTTILPLLDNNYARSGKENYQLISFMHMDILFKEKYEISHVKKKILYDNSVVS